ncbi:MAG TPA: hypothetical protein PLA71_00475 [Saccharofermentans sp.]|nr:hypothetical protein [Saccharofermentans sp.]
MKFEQLVEKIIKESADCIKEDSTKIYTIKQIRSNGKFSFKSGTLPELIEYYSNTLKAGESYQNERGRKKINTKPRTIEDLVKNIQNAKKNTAANGISNVFFDLVDNEENPNFKK